jgi:UDP-N-acetylglucosamine--N-acetylmuramyl-(pentapeptide) pyrophosphoryl-undecaprenol N-acetylglucosamine transferase
MKRILTVGGGSGGHVTPVIAVLSELRDHYPRAEVQFWCDQHFAHEARRIMDEYDPTIRVRTTVSGKFRRYSHLSALQHLLIPSVIFPNIRDAFLVLFGVGQSIFRLIMWRPDVVFAKGGYVCLPVGWAAWLLRIPLVIHDSDAHPGLTNRLLAPFATSIATGVALEHYSYPASKTTYVGIPIDSRYKNVPTDKQRELKAALGFDSDRPLTIITGGGQGSKQINDMVAMHLTELLPFTSVVLLSGTAQYDELRSLTPDDPRFLLKDFMPGLHEVFGAADVVVSRAGATAILELAAMAIPTIIVPSKRLIWQVKHAQVYADEQAIIVLDEDKFNDPSDTSLVDAVHTVLTDKKLREKLATNLHKLARPHAAKDMAVIIVRATRKQR